MIKKGSWFYNPRRDRIAGRVVKVVPGSDPEVHLRSHDNPKTVFATQLSKLERNGYLNMPKKPEPVNEEDVLTVSQLEELASDPEVQEDPEILAELVREAQGMVKLTESLLRSTLGDLPDQVKELRDRIANTRAGYTADMDADQERFSRLKNMLASCIKMRHEIAEEALATGDYETAEHAEVGKLDGVSYKIEPNIVLESEDDLPEEYFKIVPDHEAIEKAVKGGLKIPGVKVVDMVSITRVSAPKT